MPAISKPIRLFCIITAVLLFGNGVLIAQDLQRDTIYLHSGERIIGQIKGLSLGMLSIKSKDISDLSFKMARVRTIDSAVDTLQIEMINSVVYYGALKPSDQDGKVYVVTDAQKYLVDLYEINTLTPLHQRFVNNIQASASSGFSFSRSSGVGQVTLNGNIAYNSRKLVLGLTASAMYSIDTSTFSRDREEVKLSAYYNLRGKLYLAGVVDYQRNLQLSIARRFQQTFGPGWKFAPKATVQLIVFTGLSTNQELSTSGVAQNFLVEWPAGFQFNYFKFTKPNLQFTSVNDFYVSFSQWGRVRYDNTNTLAWEMITNFSLSLSLYLNYDRQPPDNSATGKIDYGIVQGFSYKF